MQTEAIPHQELTKRVGGYIRENPHLISTHWRAESFRATDGEPMTIRRAKALNAVLTQCELPVWPGELIVGCGKFHRLGPEYDLEEQSRDSQFLQTIGSRGFCEHADHHAPDYPTLLRIGFGGLSEAIRDSLFRYTDAERTTFIRSVRCSQSRRGIGPGAYRGVGCTFSLPARYRQLSKSVQRLSVSWCATACSWIAPCSDSDCDTISMLSTQPIRGAIYRVKRHGGYKTLCLFVHFE